jgi:ribosomal protein S27E
MGLDRNIDIRLREHPLKESFMAHVVPCPKCRQSLGLPEPAPARIRCPKCGTIIATRAPDSTISSGSSADFLQKPLTTAAAPPAPLAVPVQTPAVGTIAKPPTPQAAAPPPPKPPGVGRMAFLVGAGAGGLVLLAFLIILILTRGNKKNDKTEEAASPGPKDFLAPSPRRNAQDQEPERKPLSARVQKCVDAGIAYLRREIKKDKFHLSDDRAEPGRIALIALTLLECGVKANDPDIEFAARYIRRSIDTMKTTYTVAPSILFLDRLHRGKTSVPEQDARNIRTLTLRLVAGQTRSLNLWNYNVPLVDDEKAVLDALKADGVYQSPDASPDAPDLSNSQFAALALWAARQRHNLPVDGVLKTAAESVRKKQQENGIWYYRIEKSDENNVDTGTCAGLILLALGRGVRDGGPAFRDDPAVKKAMAHLRKVVNKPVAPGERALGNRFRSAGDLYFLWTLERTLLIADEPLTVDEQDWHQWGTDIIVPRQQLPEGYWAEHYSGPVDTCFALLFLVRADLFRDLTVKLRQLAMLDRPPEQLAQAPAHKPQG